MKYKKNLVFICLLICLFSIPSACASDVNDNAIISEDTNIVELSTDNDIIEDYLQTTVENYELTLTDNDETLTAKNDTEILSDNPGTYSGLKTEIGRGGNIELQHDYYAYDTGSSIYITVEDSVIDGKGAVIDMAGSNIPAFNVGVSGVTIKNITIKNANGEGNGGAIYFSQFGTVTNCNFVNNSGTSFGGAVYFWNQGTVSNCNFTNNKALEDGGAIKMYSGTVTNCNFISNTASSDGGAISMNSGNVSNCNFTNNIASKSGGAVYFLNTGDVTNCNFTNNKASVEGGAVYLMVAGDVTNCNFDDNAATDYGGAVYFYSTGDVTNCNFTNNKASVDDGGAIRMNSGTVTNCNFIGNNAIRDGGAVYIWDQGVVSNCNFIGNNAIRDGGAINIDFGNVTNCNFTGNNATSGSAIYFYNASAPKTIYNSNFMSNKANAEALEVTKNDNNIAITFMGNDNLLNAIYSNGGVRFANVAYWGANGIANTGSSTPARSNKEAGQNITVCVLVNGELVLNEVKVTDEKGMIVLNIIAGENYCITVRHDTDSYYTEAEKTITTMTFNVDVTSQTTHNKTVNITAKSNIYREFMPGKLLFVLPDGTSIDATYGANGTWWAEHTFDDSGEYKINATYVGLDNVAINSGTITINKVNSTITLNNIVLNYGESKNVTVTTAGATGITVKIGESEAKVDGFVISIPVLDAGNYTLTVTTIADEDYNPVTKEVNITVNKVNSTLTVDDIVFDYGSSGSIVVSFTGAEGVNASVIGQSDAVVKVDGANITVSRLNAGTYILTVTTIADVNHNNISKNVAITVNKVKTL